MLSMAEFRALWVNTPEALEDRAGFEAAVQRYQRHLRRHAGESAS